MAKELFLQQLQVYQVCLGASSILLVMFQVLVTVDLPLGLLSWLLHAF